MNILVIGSGGREHALVWKLAQSPRVTRLWCAPGNAGIAAERVAANQSAIQCDSIAADNLPGLLALAKDNQIDLTVVGPDNPLALGIVDLFQQHGLRIWGPNRQAAQFESSKAFSQSFMEKHAIPTARSKVFSDAGPAEKFAAELGGVCAVKADGLALGKGVLLCHSKEEASVAIDEMLVAQKFGAAGSRIVIQELLEGMEVSLHALCDGRTSRLFPTSQDHKRIGENDTGPNTGGMGAYSPTPFLSRQELDLVSTTIMGPWCEGCREEGIDFRGVLYPGVMLTKDGPKVLEFNARFGDPEAQVYMMTLETDLLDLLEACVNGTLSKCEPRFRGVAVCVVMASAGYPGTARKGQIIHGLEEADRLPNTKIFHAGTAQNGDEIITAGGRVLGVTTLGGTLAEARDRAYVAVGKIQFDGVAIFGRDIATNETLGRSRKSHIENDENAESDNLYSISAGHLLNGVWYPAISRADPVHSMPNFEEVCQILGANLEGLNADELDRAAVQGLVHQLGPRVSLVAADAGSSNAVPLADTRVLDDSFAYVRVAVVNASLPEALHDAFHQMIETNKSKIKGLVLDLRFADGFDYAAAAKVADSFLSSDHPLLDWQTGSAHATLKADAITLPVAILVNSQTTGAAEALAAVLRDTDVGLILGGQTAGHASIFKEFPLHDGAKLRVAVGSVHFGAGKALAHGVTPDIAINTSLEDERAYLQDPYKNLHPLAVAKTDAAKAFRDEPRLNEVELIREHNNGDDPDQVPARNTPDVTESAPVVFDPALARALDLLKGLAVVQPNRPG